MQTPGANTLPYLVMIPLIVWRLYARIRRSVGRQTLSSVRPWITIGIFPLLTAFIVYAALPDSQRLLSIVAGAAGGVWLGVYGHGKTKFENTPQGMFYTPNAHIGIALSLLFVARMIYRMIMLYSMEPGARPNPADFAQSPLTLAIFGLLAGYYTTYALGLVQWRLRVERESREAG
jgi:hypothetical protein